MNKNIKINNPMKVITGPDTRWSYANVCEPKSINGGTPKYSVSLIIPKSDTKTIAKIEAAIEAAYKEGEAKLKGNGKSVPALSVIKTPLRDGDMECPDDPAYANAYFVNANATSAPGIVDANRNPILTRSEVYSGMYGRASISFYAFNSSSNKGIACVLNNLVTVSLLVVRQVLSLISHLMKMTISLINGGGNYEMLQTILVVVLLAIWLLFSVVFLITAIQNLVNDHKREIREQESAKRNLEYAKGEVLITIMTSLAQQESQFLSQNVKLRLQFRYQNGQVQVNHNHFLG